MVAENPSSSEHKDLTTSVVRFFFCICAIPIVIASQCAHWCGNCMRILFDNL